MHDNQHDLYSKGLKDLAGLKAGADLVLDFCLMISLYMYEDTIIILQHFLSLYSGTQLISMGSSTLLKLVVYNLSMLRKFFKASFPPKLYKPSIKLENSLLLLLLNTWVRILSQSQERSKAGLKPCYQRFGYHVPSNKQPKKTQFSLLGWFIYELIYLQKNVTEKRVNSETKVNEI